MSRSSPRRDFNGASLVPNARRCLVPSIGPGGCMGNGGIDDLRQLGLDAPLQGRGRGGDGAVGQKAGFVAHVGDEARLLANRAIATAAAALQRSIETQLPQVIDAAVSHATARTNGRYETSSRVWHEGCTVEVASRR